LPLTYHVYSHASSYCFSTNLQSAVSHLPERDGQPKKEREIVKERNLDILGVGSLKAQGQCRELKVVMFLGGHFLFTSSDTFAVGCIADMKYKL